ncbi:MAG: hypothetical protein Q4G46_01850 [Propionibacteriaceae bacterium]|nr:hypothetical protein [Propionibacteriaceae bacterium]
MSRPAHRSSAAFGKAVVSFWMHTIVHPIRSGGPLPQRWPRPVQVVMAAVLAVYLGLLGAVLMSGLDGPV